MDARKEAQDQLQEIAVSAAWQLFSMVFSENPRLIRKLMPLVTKYLTYLEPNGRQNLSPAEQLALHQEATQHADALTKLTFELLGPDLARELFTEADNRKTLDRMALALKNLSPWALSFFLHRFVPQCAVGDKDYAEKARPTMMKHLVDGDESGLKLAEDLRGFVSSGAAEFAASMAGILGDVQIEFIRIPVGLER